MSTTTIVGGHSQISIVGGCSVCLAVPCACTAPATAKGWARIAQDMIVQDRGYDGPLLFLGCARKPLPDIAIGHTPRAPRQRFRKGRRG